LLNGDKIWLEEGFHVPTKKDKKEELLKKDHPPYPKMKEGLHIKLINNHMEGSRCHHLMDMKYVKCKHGGVGQPRHHILHHTRSSRSFHGAPSNKCKKKEPQTFPIKLETFTIGAIQTRTGTSKDTTRRTININHRKMEEEGGIKENNNAFKFGLIFSYFSLL
jgi:hypothetical protein